MFFEVTKSTTSQQNKNILNRTKKGEVGFQKRKSQIFWFNFGK